MMVLVTYDVSTMEAAGRKRLQRVARACESWGQRVQNSVFECLVDPAQWENLKAQLLERIDSEEDSLRFYYLGSNWRNRVEHHGAKATPDPEGVMLV